ncbi:MAG: ethanolamine ammonia-lyase subunit EutC [Gemmataceae bacterium]
MARPFRDEHYRAVPMDAPRESEAIDLLACTPARLLAGRAGTSYRTATSLELRRDHAAARDAVWTELNLPAGLDLPIVQTLAANKQEYLLRPDLGRRFSPSARATLAADYPTNADIQVVVGDGLSATAVAAQVPQLLPRLRAGAVERNWSFGRPFAIRYCRVGILNEIGELLDPAVVVLLVGERPGLATAESLSAYMAHRPRPGHTDAHRNLISNIHARGIGPDDAAARILGLADEMKRQGTSGVTVKEVLGGLPSLH